ITRFRKLDGLSQNCRQCSRTISMGSLKGTGGGKGQMDQPELVLLAPSHEESSVHYAYDTMETIIDEVNAVILELCDVVATRPSTGGRWRLWLSAIPTGRCPCCSEPLDSSRDHLCERAKPDDGALGVAAARDHYLDRVESKEVATDSTVEEPPLRA